jgi:phosphatidylinositol alpha-1,6-mannosyltransferase
MPNREINGDTEGFGIVYLEAAACAKPAIAGRAGGTGSAVVHNMTGVQVDGANIASVRAALENLLFDTGRAAVLGAAGRDRAVRDYSWSRVAEQTRRIILDRH